MKNISKKIVTILIAIVFVSTIIIIPAPRARAWGVVFDPANLGEQVARLGEDIARWVKDDLMATLRDMVVKTLVDQMTNNIIDSINNGGSPRYITNWKSYLGKAGDVAFSDLNDYLKKVNGSDLCAPFYPAILSNLRSRINHPYGELPSPGSSCSFSNFKSNLRNSQHFIEKGGWSAYDQLFVPSNNYWLSEELVQDKYQRDLALNKEARKTEAIANNGFLSIKKCVNREPGWTSDTGESIPGKCTKWRTVTPGKAVADAMSTAINSNAWYMTNVKSIISAIANSLISKVLGSAGLPGSGSGSTGGETYSVSNTSDLGNRVAKSNSDSLNYIRKGYTGIKNYATRVKSKIDGSISQIGTLASCSSGLVSNFVTRGDSSNISCVAENNLRISYNVLSSNYYTTSRQTSLVNSLKSDLIAESAHLGNAINGAAVGLNEINSIDLNSVNTQLQISTAYSNYNNFIAQYPVINSDVTYVNAGLNGKLLVKYGSIYSAVTTYSCASTYDCSYSNSGSDAGQ